MRQLSEVNADCLVALGGGSTTGLSKALALRTDLPQIVIPTTYAGGANSLHDLEEVTRASQNRVHLTIGSALDIFGGKGVCYADAVEFNRQKSR